MSGSLPASPYFHVDLQGGVAIITFDDIQVSPDSKDDLYALVERLESKRLVLNLGNIAALSTYALGILANLQRRVESAGGQVKFCCLGPDMTKLFRMTKFDQIFEVHPSQDDALRSF